MLRTPFRPSKIPLDNFTNKAVPYSSHFIGFSGRQRSLDCQRRLPLYFPCASYSQLRNLSENNLNNISILKIYYLIRGNLKNWAFLFAILLTSCLYHDVSSRSLNFLRKSDTNLRHRSERWRGEGIDDPDKHGDGEHMRRMTQQRGFVS